MTESFFFYDLETSGFDPRSQRIMQFAGQRTSLTLEPIGEPVDVLIRITEDILPDPDALLMTGITPQQTLADGLTEREFLQIFHEEIATPGTIFVGYNSIRFDDEFMRALHYRNLYDPYEWQWKEDRSKWDLLDVVRMTRALRPEGIKWPVSADGVQVNRLEKITALNGIAHEKAHNALHDVLATIDLARLVRGAQPKLFDYLLGMRHKRALKELVASATPFVYTSGRYSSEYEKTTVVVPLIEDATGSGMYVYDLRFDPAEWLAANDPDPKASPLKLMKYNHCPAVAPLGVLDEASWQRIGLTKDRVASTYEAVNAHRSALEERCKPAQKPAPQTLLEMPLKDVDAAIYQGFFDDKDKKTCSRICQLSAEEIVDFAPEFDDVRLPGLFFLYKARQFPKSLLAEDRVTWENYVAEKLLSGEVPPLTKYMQRLQELASKEYLDADKRYILEELALYGQSIAPLDGDIVH